jgi:hypothetical protein
MYLAWFDANPKKPVAQKIAEAHQRYVEKFGRKPLVCLVNPEDVIAESAVELRPLKHIGRNCFWIGFDDVEGAEQGVAEPAPAAAPRARKPQAAPAIAASIPATEATPETKPATPRPRKPKAAPTAPAIAPGAAVIADAATVALPTRKARGAPTEKPTAPAPAVVPAPKRRARREIAAA